MGYISGISFCIKRYLIKEVMYTKKTSWQNIKTKLNSDDKSETILLLFKN
jgi:hypothetical protein